MRKNYNKSMDETRHGHKQESTTYSDYFETVHKFAAKQRLSICGQHQDAKLHM